MYKPRGQNFGHFWPPPYVDTFTKYLLLSVVVSWATPLPPRLSTPPRVKLLIENWHTELNHFGINLFSGFWANQQTFESIPLWNICLVSIYNFSSPVPHLNGYMTSFVFWILIYWSNFSFNCAFSAPIWTFKETTRNGCSPKNLQIYLRTLFWI